MNENQDKFSRQILAFGKEGQQRLAAVRVGIVGLGGMGSLIVQMLVFLGVREFVLVDDDIVEETNLNRLVGAASADVKNKTAKIEVAKRVIASVNPSAKVTALFKNLRSKEALDVLCNAPAIIFGCVDNDSSRLILSELASAYKKTLIDCACEIERDGTRVIEFGGRVVVARPGDFCLFCANQIDREVARQELESDAERSFRKDHGYGLGAAEPAPAVISLNATIASLAVTEFMMFVTGLREPQRMLTYKGLRGIVTASQDVKKPDCFVCSSLVGKTDKADLKKYLRYGLPKDLPK